ncbi:aspartyl-phosphate phosphatase Spo0E family protein [Halalkalibacter alkalisediminis]|uniref:Spo0E family sporulation regulatory protein-aspartic acid phosphatase n=1 Tax=Halalkalibacter alkalisediminis TaxID=935616 RepID=A0ABV6N9Y8_9BACI|nr:aspartyl-phosphate phosphatase Spo0E family protein [Halalkalibacter alkalisediminis]
MKKEEILSLIELKREQLYFYVENFGMVSKEALKCSEELDIFIITYQKLRD